MLSPPANSPASSATSDTAATTTPALWVWAAKRDAGSVEPSRTAAIGGTRVARLAGRMLATRVVRVPTTIERTIVRGAMTVAASGSSMPVALNSATRPFASPMPTTSPITEASRPMTRPSATTDRMTCLREAPSVRRVANSRVRWATVIDSVLKITNAPTSSAMPPKPSRKYFRIDIELLSSWASSLACLTLSLTWRLPGTSGATARTSSFDDVPLAAAMEIES